MMYSKFNLEFVTFLINKEVNIKAHSINFRMGFFILSLL